MIIVTKAAFLETYKRKYRGLAALDKYSWFPLKASPELSWIVACLQSDGHVSIKHGLIHFTSKYLSEVNNFRGVVEKLFPGINCTIRRSNQTDTFECLITNQPFARLMYLCGVTVGNKTIQSYGIPAWIQNGSRLLQKSFLQGLFECEGYVKIRRERIVISFSQAKSIDLKENLILYLESIKRLLLRFNIKTSNVTKNWIRPYKNRVCLALEINGSAKSPVSVLNFLAKIDLHGWKKEKLIYGITKIMPQKAPVDLFWESSVVERLSRKQEAGSSNLPWGSKISKIF